MGFRNRFYGYLFGGCMLTVLWCCRAKTDNNQKVFNYNEPSGIATLDPAFAKNQSVIWACHQLFNGLVETDSNLSIIPSLACSWKISPDRKTYTFYLRNDVYFQDHPSFPGGIGRKCSAADVVFSFERIIDPQVASPGAWIFNGRVSDVQPFKAINDSTFELNLRQPFSPILGVLAMKYCSIVPREALSNKDLSFAEHPCGTGPFTFHSWEAGQSLILLKNEHYFERDEEGRQLPYIDAVKVSFYDSKATEFLLFRQGQLDFINDIDPSFKDEVLSKKGTLKKEWEGIITLQKHAYLNTEYLGILVDTSSDIVRSSPLRSLKVRQAINYGFDREKMMLYLRNSIGMAAVSGFVPRGLPSFDAVKVKGFYYDPDKARSLIQEAGFSATSPPPPVKLLTIPIYADLAGFIARQLEGIGLSVTVDVVPKSLLLEQTAQSKAPFFRASWIADYPDAENFLSVFYGKNPAPPNYTRYHNKEFDALYDKAMLATDEQERYDLYRQMDQLILKEAPIVPLWYDEVIHLVSTQVEGFRPNALNLLELRRVKKASNIKKH